MKSFLLKRKRVNRIKPGARKFQKSYDKAMNALDMMYVRIDKRRVAIAIARDKRNSLPYKKKLGILTTEEQVTYDLRRENAVRLGLPVPKGL